MKNLETETIVKLLRALLDYPCLFSLIEADLADELEARGLFSLDTFSVSAWGRDYLALNQLAG